MNNPQMHPNLPPVANPPRRGHTTGAGSVGSLTGSGYSTDHGSIRDQDSVSMASWAPSSVEFHAEEFRADLPENIDGMTTAGTISSEFKKSTLLNYHNTRLGCCSAQNSHVPQALHFNKDG
jgi:hypothetical protein